VKGFVYDKDSFDMVEEFSYPGEGWGITHDQNRLIMSNGSATLSFLDPVTFKVTGTVQVNDGNTPVTNLNELEYINGDVYANVWHQERIAIINVQTGQVKGWINLSRLYDVSNVDPENVLNGIAYDADGSRLFVTGKRWPQLFEITIKPAA
jgi:glutamine cyclotransferase